MDNIHSDEDVTLLPLCISLAMLVVVVLIVLFGAPLNTKFALKFRVFFV